MKLERRLAQLFRVEEKQVQLVGKEMTGVTGYLSYRRRAKVRRDGEELAVFVKQSDGTRWGMAPYTELSVGYSQHEVVFYSSLCPVLRRAAEQCGMQLPLPLVYQEVVEPKGSLLVMEDLSCQGFELATAPMPLEQVRCVLRAMAELQAAFSVCRHRLGDSEMADRLLGSRSPLAEPDDTSFDELLEDALKTFGKKAPKFVDAERLRVIDKWLRTEVVDSRDDASWRQLSQCPPGDPAVGVVHGDLWFNNCLLRRSDCRLVDWQFASVGRLGHDIGTFWLSGANNSFAVDEFLNSVDYFHETMREIFEAKTGAEFPVGVGRLRAIAVQSLRTAVVWLLLSADTMWDSPAVMRNALANTADLLQHFRP